METAMPMELAGPRVRRHVHGGTWRWALRAAGVAVVCTRLAACGGHVAEPAPLPVQPEAPAAVRTLRVTVLDAEGLAYPGAKVSVSNGYYVGNTTWKASAIADARGEAVIAQLPDELTQAWVYGSSELGYGTLGNSEAGIPVNAAGETLATVRLGCDVGHVVLPARILPDSINADRSGARLRVSIAMPRGWEGLPWDLGTCYWLECSVERVDTDGASAQVPLAKFPGDFELFTPLQAPAVTAAGPQSTLLALDQGQRIRTYDPEKVRERALRHFIRRQREGDVLGLGGFAETGLAGASQPLLPQVPFWLAMPPVPAGMALEELAPELERMVGGASAVLAGMDAALDALGNTASNGTPRTLVALLGGGDDSGLSPAQWQERATALRQKAAGHGIQTILVAADNRPAQASLAGRREIAMLGAALEAPVVSWDWGNQYGNLDVVADLLRGEYSVFSAEIQLSGPPDTFQSGSTLLLPLVLYNWAWGAWWWEGYLQVAVRVP